MEWKLVDSLSLSHTHTHAQAHAVYAKGDKISHDPNEQAHIGAHVVSVSLSLSQTLSHLGAVDDSDLWCRKYGAIKSLQDSVLAKKKRRLISTNHSNCLHPPSGPCGAMLEEHCLIS